jgi:hypothetical protein
MSLIYFILRPLSTSGHASFVVDGARDATQEGIAGASVAGKSQRAPRIRKQPRSKADRDRSGLRKFILKPISPAANPCCNRALKIGVVPSLGMSDATALYSKQQTG